MLRQAMATPSRAVRSALRVSAQRSSLPAPRFRPTPLAAAWPSRLTNIRWYSAETDKPAAESSNGNAEGQETPAEPPLDAESAVRKEVESKAKEALEWKDRYLRSVADFRNLQDRTTRDMKAARDFAIQKFAKDLVDSVDNLDRAMANVPHEKLNAQEKTEHLQDLINLYEGLKLTESIMMQTLAKHGLERFDPHGEKFNPNEHEATFMTPMAEKADNTVFHTQQKGFRLNGRILRPAKVGVVKNK